MAVSIRNAWRLCALAVTLALGYAVAPGALAQESAAPVTPPAVTEPAAPPPASSDAPAPATAAPVASPAASPMPPPTSPMTPAAEAAAPASPSAQAAPQGEPAAPSAGAPTPSADSAATGTAAAQSVPGAAPAETVADPGAVASTKPAPGEITADKLPHDLSPWNMFMQADMIVKGVMLGLLFASFVTWTVWFAKSIELVASKRKVARALQRIDEARTLSELETYTKQRRGVGPALLKATMQELHVSWGAHAAHGIKERIASRLDRIEIAATRHINKGTGVLATIGSTAPFVGLFGTVWGIMNSFIGISESKTTNLAIVAPGIAEALLATAFGLVAAIPAVIFYNQLARSISGYKALVGDTAAAVMRLASRDLERGSANSAGLRAAE